MEMGKESARLGTLAAHPLLSGMHHSLYTAIMPLSANLLRICQASHTEAWTFQGAGFGNMAYLEMQPLGWFGL